ncbi:hypothetical protein TNCV_3028591 [Trichonephila clavipes]|nr:hypothetical protein TNCV_3028591 [Trichonephila clavipes]
MRRIINQWKGLRKHSGYGHKFVARVSRVRALKPLKTRRLEELINETEKNRIKATEMFYQIIQFKVRFSSNSYPTCDYILITVTSSLIGDPRLPNGHGKNTWEICTVSSSTITTEYPLCKGADAQLYPSRFKILLLDSVIL